MSGDHARLNAYRNSYVQYHLILSIISVLCIV